MPEMTESKLSVKLDLNDIETAAKVCNALSSEVRLEILKILVQHAASIGELTEYFQLPMSSMCMHVKKLKEAGLEAYVQIEKDGVYSVFRRIQRLNIKSTESIHDLNSVEALTNLDPVKAVPDLDSVEAILDLDSIVVVVSGDTTDCFSAERALSSYSHWNYENYINTPKANRYQAIHFTISSEGKNCWRIRICSEDGYKLNKDAIADK